MGVSRFSAEAQRALAFGSIVAGYAAIGTAFSNPISKIFLVNATDALLQFSMDGATDHWVLPSEGFLLLDVTMEAKVPDYIATASSMYVKRIGTPTTGSVYLSAFYGRNR